MPTQNLPSFPVVPTRYQIEVDGQTYDAAVIGCSEQGWHVRVAEQTFTLQLPSGTATRFDDAHLLVDEGSGFSRPVRVSSGRDGLGAPTALTMWRPREAPHTFDVRVEGVRRADEPGRTGRKGARGGNGAKGAPGQVTAPMNGQVFKVLHEPGDTLAAGDVVLVLEAMKMENEVSTPVAGVLQAMHVTKGATVRPGALLFEVTPDSTASA